MLQAGSSQRRILTRGLCLATSDCCSQLPTVLLGAGKVAASEPPTETTCLIVLALHLKGMLLLDPKA